MLLLLLLLLLHKAGGATTSPTTHTIFVSDLTVKAASCVIAQAQAHHIAHSLTLYKHSKSTPS